MNIPQDRQDRARRYRLEATYLRGLMDTVGDRSEREALRRIAEAYERLAEQLSPGGHAD